jgi:hypothetical protein
MTHELRLPFLAHFTLGLLAFPALAEEVPSAPDSSQAMAGAAPEAATTAAPAAEAAGPSGRQLAGHTFMPVLGIVGPFATTSFGTFLTLGAGSTHGAITLQVPGSSRPPQTFRGEVSYAVIGGIFGYEYAFLRDFAARIVLAETLYSGTTGAGAAVVGTNARLSGDVGLTGGLTIGDSLRLSGVFDASYAPRIGLLLGPAVKSAYESCTMGITECTFDFGKLFESENVLTLTPGVAAAWAPLQALGVTGNVSYVSSSIVTEGSELGYDALSFGAALDFDFHEISSVPVGIQATWNSLVRIAGSDAFSFTDLGGGVFYTGRDNLSLGLQAVNRRFRVVPEVDVSWSTFVASLGLRYYWN